MKPQIDASAPKVCGMKHLKTNWKRDELMGCRYDEIERDNRHLLQKMSHIAQEPGSAPSKSKSAPSLHLAPENRFPGGPARRTEIQRIEHENARLLRNLQTMKGEYVTKDSEKSYEESRKVMRRITEYPLPNMKLRRRVRSTASLQPLARDDMGAQAGSDPSAVAQDYASPSGGSKGLRYVLREHLLIGGTAHFVEIATDGQTLAISAYDREVEDTYELLVNEENHRRLLEDNNGDYGEIAGRLRIRDDQLIIVPREAEEAVEAQ
jgi:hypothetical protein